MRVVGVAAACLLALGSCGLGAQNNASRTAVDPSPITVDASPVPQGLEEFYNQEPQWESCGNKLECTKITVPLDYAHPDGESIEIAVKKRNAGVEAIGSLLVNPGGPGAIGTTMADQAAQFFSTTVTDHFDVVGFDPRGVQESAPVDCVSDSELQEIVMTAFPDAEEGEQESQQMQQRLIDGCAANAAVILPFVGTENAARDMDVIRAVLGDPKLYYVGFSYGTSLGGQYAQLFPSNVGRMILDGAVAPGATTFEQTEAQLKGFERSIDAYLQDCDNRVACPFSGDIEAGREKISAAFDEALSRPFPTPENPDRELTQAGLLLGIITPLYDDESWEVLDVAFSELFKDSTGDVFLALADAYTSYEDGEFTDNSMEANWAINCADYRADGTPEQWQERQTRLEEEAPLFGPVFGYDEYMCANWPYQPQHSLEPYVAQGSAPIVVVGTVGDPATPYEWAVDFADTLDNAVLVTWEGEGHTAYARSTQCVSDPLDEYLVSGVVPEDGLTCPAR